MNITISSLSLSLSLSFSFSTTLRPLIMCKINNHQFLRYRSKVKEIMQFALATLLPFAVRVIFFILFRFSLDLNIVNYVRNLVEIIVHLYLREEIYSRDN